MPCLTKAAALAPVLALAVLVGLPPRARAAGIAVCSAESTQMDLDVCADQDFAKSDAELNADYRKIQDRLKNEAAIQKLLVAAQKAWISFRDSECDFATSQSAQGSIYPMLAAQCRTSLTQARIKQLQTYLVCEEGDLSCPVPRQ